MLLIHKNQEYEEGKNRRKGRNLKNKPFLLFFPSSIPDFCG